MFREICEGVEALKSIARSLKEFVQLEKAERAASGFKIQQTNGGNMQSDIKGIVKGATGKFTASTTPPGGQLLAGNIPKWTADDTSLTITPAADGLSADVSVLSSDPATSFNLTVSGISSSGVPISSVVNVPLSTGSVATGFDIKQTS